MQKLTSAPFSISSVLLCGYRTSPNTELHQRQDLGLPSVTEITLSSALEQALQGQHQLLIHAAFLDSSHRTPILTSTDGQCLQSSLHKGAES